METLRQRPAQSKRQDSLLTSAGQAETVSAILNM